MTAENAWPAPGTAPLGAEPPPPVAAAAAERRLGPRVASRFLANPFVAAGTYFLLALLCLGGLVLLGNIGDGSDGILYAVLRIFALFFCFAFVGLLTLAIATLARGAQSFHVYAGGFVHRRNGKIRAFAWPEVAELKPVVITKGDSAGKVHEYRLVPRQGGAVKVPLVIENGRDEYMDRLMAVLGQNGIPVR